MPAKKLKTTDIEDVIRILPAREREKLRQQELTAEWLEGEIERCKGLMKRDFWVGFPWFIAYSISLFKVGMNNFTIAIFVIGVVYFVYTTFTTGTYGLNQKRVKVYEELLTRIK